MGREFLLGAVLGEWGADDHDNIYYLGSWVASGVIVIGDIRDIAATISRGDLVGTGLNLAALIPGYGDAAKVAAVVGTFVLKHPALLKPAMVLLVGVAPHVDEGAEWANTFRKIHGDDAVNKFLKGGITEADLNVIAKNTTPRDGSERRYPFVPEIDGGGIPGKNVGCGVPRRPLTPPPPTPARVSSWACSFFSA